MTTPSHEETACAGCWLVRELHSKALVNRRCTLFLWRRGCLASWVSPVYVARCSLPYSPAVSKAPFTTPSGQTLRKDYSRQTDHLHSHLHHYIFYISDGLQATTAATAMSNNANSLIRRYSGALVSNCAAAQRVSSLLPAEARGEHSSDQEMRLVLLISLALYFVFVATSQPERHFIR